VGFARYEGNIHPTVLVSGDVCDRAVENVMHAIGQVVRDANMSFVHDNDCHTYVMTGTRLYPIRFDANGAKTCKHFVDLSTSIVIGVSGVADIGYQNSFKFVASLGTSTAPSK
jgi:hypothetical protein